MAETTFYPAYGLFASAVELLGRCIRGNQGTGQTGSNLKLGLQWLVAPDLTRYESINDTDIVVRTRSYAYSVAELV